MQEPERKTTGEHHFSSRKTDMGSIKSTESDLIKNENPAFINRNEFNKICAESFCTNEEVAVSVLHQKNLDQITENPKDVLMVKENNMDIDERSKGSSMDVDSLIKDDIMDIDLEDHMDVDNELMNNSNININGLPMINEEVKSALFVERSTEVSPTAEKNETTKAGIYLDVPKNYVGEEVIPENVLEKTEGENVVASSCIESETSAQKLRESETEKTNKNIANPDEDLIKLNDTVGEGNLNVTTAFKSSKSNCLLDSSIVDSNLVMPSTVNSDDLSLIPSNTAADALTNCKPTDFSISNFNDEANSGILLDTEANENLNRTSGPSNEVKLLVEGENNAMGEKILDKSTNEDGSSLRNDSSNQNSKNVAEVSRTNDSEELNVEKHEDKEKNPDNGEKEISMDMFKPSNEDGIKEKLSKCQDEDKEELIVNVEKNNDRDSREQYEAQIQESDQMEKLTKPMNTGESQSLICEETMDFDSEENGLSKNVHQLKNNSEGGVSILEKILKTSKPVNEIKDALDEVSELAEISEEKNLTDPFTDTKPGEKINNLLEDENDEVPFGIVATATIAPNEFENLISAGDVNEDQLTEESTELGEPESSVPQLADLAMKVVMENKGEETSVPLKGKKINKKPIRIKTIKQEKLDFGFEGESCGQFEDQIDIKPNLPLLENAFKGEDKPKRSKKKNLRKTKRHNKGIRKILQQRSEAKKRRENKVLGKNSDSDAQLVVEDGADENSKKSPDKNKGKKKYDRTLGILKKLQIDMNDMPSSTKRKLTRSSLNETHVNETSPVRKRTRLSLPDLKKENRSLRSTVDSTPKSEYVKKPEENAPIPTKRRNIAVKSTTAQVKFRKDLKIVEKKFRNVARKRGQPYFKKRSDIEPAPIFVDTNFGSQNIDMFINENEDDEPVLFYDSRDKDDHDKVRKCKIVIERNPVFDRLLRVKKSVNKIEPNLCDLCEPKRVFLTKSSLAEHIKDEHISNLSGTSALPQTKSEVEVHNETKSCSVCKKFFHSKNRLAAHVKTCKSEISEKIINQVPGVDLRNLGNVTISLSSPEVNKSEEKKSVTTVNSIKHECELCQKRFLMAAGLRSHMKTHKNSEKNKSSLPKPGKLNLMCNICDKTFRFCSDLAEHISFHSLTSEKEKEILTSNLKKISNIQINIESIPETESSESETDNTTDDDDDSSDYSYKGKIKTSSKMYFAPNKCFECGRVFTIKAVYERHVGLISKISNLKDQAKCPVCDLEIKFRCKLGAHLETHKPQTEEQLICKKCNKTFRCENNLIRHELEHEGKLKVNCQYCSYSFHSMSDLYAHQEECKFKCSEYKCNLCKRVFTAKWRLDLHMKTDEKHGTDPQQPNTYFCDQCGREFKHLSVLKRHVDSRCGTEPLYECPDCDKKYFSQGSLASHKRTQHSTEKNFMCQYCSKDFFTKHQLHRHELRHNPDIRPYRCKYPNCDKTYRQPDSLRAHECEHTGLYPYVCEFCGLQFSNVKSLKLHRKSSNHWSDVEPNKVVTQACRQKHLGKKLGEKYLEGKQVSEEEEIDPEGHEDEPKNLVINESQYEGVYNERIAIPQQVPQYSNLQPFTVNHLMQSQQSSVLVQSAHPLATYTQAIENYFVIASQQEPMAGVHHSMMN